MLLAKKIRITDYPEVIFCLSYQDGLIHAFEHFLHHVQYGESLCKVKITNILKSYEKRIKEKQSRKKWFDVAYLKGYLNGHIFVMLKENERKLLPHYLDLSMHNELSTFREYKKSLTTTERRRKSISEYASKFVKEFQDADIVVQHTPFL